MIYAQSGPGGVGNGSNNVVWLKADAGTSSVSDGAAISLWQDQSGNAIDVSQATGVRQPIYRANVLNGFPAIEFDNNSSSGQNDFMTAPDHPMLDNTDGYTFFAVTRMSHLNGEARNIMAKRVGVDNQHAFMMFYYTSNYLFLDIDNSNNRFNSSPAAYANNVTNIHGAVYDGTLAAANRSKIYEGETLRRTSTESSALVADKNSPFVIGATHIGDSRPFGGMIAEVIVYRTALNDASRIIVNNYLSAKYNSPLAANDYYAGDNPANGDYDRAVSGIGREASGSSDSFASTVSGGLAITAHAGLEVGDYLLAGHASPQNLQISTDVGGMTGTHNARWQRIWYMDVTNTGAPVSAAVEFDISDGDIPYAVMGTVADYVLLYRAGQSGNWTEMAVASSIVGDRVVFDNVDIVNDGYYTIGTKNYPDSPLPVQLLNFAVEMQSSQAIASWNTLSESGNAYFTVEKSLDGINFEPVGTINGAGNSASLLSYSMTDRVPYTGKSYYRLKQTDVDGTFSYSSVLTLNNVESETSLSVFPNPVSSSDPAFYISLSSDEEEVLVVVRDIHGREFFSRVMVNTTGNELITVNPDEPLAAGMYLVVASSSHHIYSRKFIVR